MSTTEAKQYPNEYQEKAAYLYQIVKFIDWPELKKTNSPIHFCVFGRDPFWGALNNIHLRKIKERELHISYINQNFQIVYCDILYVQKKLEADFIPQRYPLIIKNNILTIGENTSFARNGGIIGIALIDHKLRIEINLQAAADAHIKIHSNLIEIASQLYQRGQY